MSADPEIIPYGERGWLCRMPGADDVISVSLAASAIADQIRETPGVTDAVAGIDSVAVRFDPARLSAEQARRLLHETVRAAQCAPNASPREAVLIPVCYGGAHGPDLAALSERCGLSEDAVIDIHSQAEYTVAAVGFAPGFAYIGPLDNRLSTQRRDTPRTQVPAGSVGVAGAFTCVYPLPSPGGWRLIGRTAMPLFDPSVKEPFVLKPGVKVRFTPIDADAFETLKGTP